MAAAGSSDLYERRRAARQEVQALKDRVKALKREKAHDTLSGCMKSKGEGEFMFEARRVLAGHYGKVYAMHWAADSQHLVSASQDGKLIVWDAMEQIRKYGVNLVSAWVMTCAFDQTAEGRTVASGGLDNTCSLYKLDMPGRLVKEPMLELTGHEGYLSCCRFVDGTNTILTSSGDWTCTLWDVEKAKNKQDFRGHTADVMFVALNPQRPNEFVSGSVDSTALIWDMRAGSKPQLSYIGHESDINAVAFMGNGYSFATGSDDYSCLLFDTRSKGQVAKYAAPRSSAASGLSINGGVYGLDFSKSGRVLFAAYEDGKAVAWETISKERMYHKIEHTGTEGESDKKRMSGVGVSPDGKSVCTASWDTTLHVWA